MMGPSEEADSLVVSYYITSRPLIIIWFQAVQCKWQVIDIWPFHRSPLLSYLFPIIFTLPSQELDFNTGNIQHTMTLNSLLFLKVAFFVVIVLIITFQGRRRKKRERRSRKEKKEALANRDSLIMTGRATVSLIFWVGPTSQTDCILITDEHWFFELIRYWSDNETKVQLIELVCGF